MPRRRYIFDPPERFVAGTVGEPGDRTFFLQARDGGRVVSIVLEKVQVAVLADRLGELLAELERRGVDTVSEIRDGPGGDVDVEPLDEPLNEAFRAGSLTLGWDGDPNTTYEVLRGEAGERIATVTGTSFTDIGLLPNTPYVYSVRGAGQTTPQVTLRIG